ncbi:MFS transporter [Actinoplanes sp. NBRC 14428]|uniref:MFS transporter n=1 Tax=Pseudosporangium ferrugineum TaxID=439699 RepID=A0A2T0S273_9ACTN|nr:MFS transporter [Pseudosporangium ferrugineum]PRY27514.1 MFS transporter [Pseudosporangium ferrugineum]BCJ55723.1 MFS transporter [Actinoplanes sp. NBRC 14428]
MSTLTAARAQRRFLILLALRWLPVGLMIPVIVLLPLERGLTLAQYGSAAALQGLAVLLLELPTGGLSDAMGRRPVLLLAGFVDIASLCLLTFADSVPLFLAFYLLQGVYRALDSGPLEAWYVDHALAADEHADIEAGLSRSGVVVGVAIAAGALITGGLVALGPYGPVTALSSPVYVALFLQAVSLVAVATLMTEARTHRGFGALAASVRGVPAAIGGAFGLVRRSRVVLALIAVEVFWGFGMVAFESLTPVRLADVLGDANRASALMGPVGSVAWLASAAGAAVIPVLARRIGAPWTGFTLRIVQGVTVAGMALFAGPVGVIAAFLLCYAVHGAANPVHSGLLHRQVEGPYRASLVSLNSMVGQPAGSLGLVVLTAIAASASLVVSLLVAAAVLALAAPLYLVARRSAPETVPAAATEVMPAP